MMSLVLHGQRRIESGTALGGIWSARVPPIHVRRTSGQEGKGSHPPEAGAGEDDRAEICEGHDRADHQEVIALFSAPIEATTYDSGMPVLVIGVAVTDEPNYIVIDDDGKTLYIPMSNVTMNWRYNWRDHEWVEVGDMNGTQDDPLDGGPDLSGPISEPDGVGPSDPIDTQGG